MKKLLLIIVLAQTLLLAPKTFAATPVGTGGDELKNIFGTLEPPQNVEAYSADTAGLIRLLSNVLKISVVAAGIFGLINLVVSGIQWAAAAGNPEMIKQASSRIWMSLLGLVIVAGAFVLAGVIGLLFFGSATAIINPVIFGPTAPPTP